MKDVFGNILEIGDVVAVTPKNYRGLVKATVKSFTSQNVRVEYVNNWNSSPGQKEEYLVPPISLVKYIQIEEGEIAK